MPEPAKAAPAAIGVSIGLGVLALLFYALTLATLSDLAGSDAAGNGYAQAYAAIEIIIVWSLLAVIAIIAGVKRRHRLTGGAGRGDPDPGLWLCFL